MTNGRNRVDYTPNAGFSGIENITYTLRDSHGLTSTGLADGVGRYGCRGTGDPGAD